MQIRVPVDKTEGS